eukprot:g532.t1
MIGSFFFFAYSNDVRSIEYLLSKDDSSYISDCDKHGRTALHWAASAGGSNVVKVLLKNGADPNAVDNFGLTPWMHATICHRLSVLELLPTPSTSTIDASKLKDFFLSNVKEEEEEHVDVDSFIISEETKRKKKSNKFWDRQPMQKTNPVSDSNRKNRIARRVRYMTKDIAESEGKPLLPNGYIWGANFSLHEVLELFSSGASGFRGKHVEKNDDKQGGWQGGIGAEQSMSPSQHFLISKLTSGYFFSPEDSIDFTELKKNGINWKAIQISSNWLNVEETNTQFQRASIFVRSTLFATLEKDLQLKLYALYKQATFGKCSTSQPSFLQVRDREKWKAWNDCNAMSMDDAKNGYVNLVTSIEPEWEKDTIISNRKKTETQLQSSSIVGFCGSTLCSLFVCGEIVRALEIHSLFVHPDHRGRRLTPALVQEMIMHGINVGVQHAIHTHAKRLPGIIPIATATYYVRPLSRAFIGKHRDILLRQHFPLQLDRYEMLTDVITKLQIFKKKSSYKTRRMRKEDLSNVYVIWQDWLKRGNFQLAPHFNENELHSLLLPNSETIFSYVVFEERNEKIIGFFSYYELVDSNTDVRACMLLYSVSSIDLSVKEILEETVRTAEEIDKFDVFYSLDISGYKKWLPQLHFKKCGEGAQQVHYYIYNYSCTPPLDVDEVALVLP